MRPWNPSARKFGVFSLRFEKGLAQSLSLRHDHGSQFRSVAKSWTTKPCCCGAARPHHRHHFGHLIHRPMAAARLHPILQGLQNIQSSSSRWIFGSSAPTSPRRRTSTMSSPREGGVASNSPSVSRQVTSRCSSAWKRCSRLPVNRAVSRTQSTSRKGSG